LNHVESSDMFVNIYVPKTKHNCKNFKNEQCKIKEIPIQDAKILHKHFEPIGYADIETSIFINEPLYVPIRSTTDSSITKWLPKYVDWQKFLTSGRDV